MAGNAEFGLGQVGNMPRRDPIASSKAPQKRHRARHSVVTTAAWKGQSQKRRGHEVFLLLTWKSADRMF